MNTGDVFSSNGRRSGVAGLNLLPAPTGRLQAWGRPVPSDDKLRRIAGHEAGHVVADHACGLSIDLATIDPVVARAGRAGCVFGTPDNYDCRPLQEFSAFPLRELMPEPLIIDGHTISAATCVHCYARTIACLAGTEAERLLFPNRTPMAAGSDIKKATGLASIFARAATAAFLNFAIIDAARILAANKHQIEAIAAALLECKTLDGAEIDDILAGMTLAQMAERARRKQMAAMTAGAALFTASHGGLQMLRV
jgi:hypothetical protein